MEIETLQHRISTIEERLDELENLKYESDDLIDVIDGYDINMETVPKPLDFYFTFASSNSPAPYAPTLMTDMNDQLEQLKQENDQLRAQNQQLTKERDEALQMHALAKQELDEEKKQRQAIEKQLADLKEQLHALKAEIAATSSKSDGFFKKIGSLSIQFRRNSDTRPRKGQISPRRGQRNHSEITACDIDEFEDAIGAVSRNKGSRSFSVLETKDVKNEQDESPRKTANKKRSSEQRPPKHNGTPTTQSDSTSQNGTNGANGSSGTSKAMALLRSLQFGKNSSSKPTETTDTKSTKDKEAKASCKTPTRNRFASVSAPIPTINAPTSKASSQQYGVALGVKRGACAFPCTCEVYVKKESGFGCKTCGHFPDSHADLGRLSDDEKEPKPAPPVSPRKSTVRVIERVLSMSAPPPKPKEDYTQQTKSQLKEQLENRWLLDYSDFYFVEQLGKGTSSTVFLGTYKGTEVALKVLRLENHRRDLEDFKKELEIMSQVKNPHIVHFYGATIEPKLVICLEYCSGGSLFHYLQDPNKPVSWSLIIRWAMEITSGINFLHQFKPQIVHRDLKSLNLLLDSNLSIKVCDFGLSRFVQPDQALATLFKLRGTYAYIAPEVYHGSQFTTKSDVYSIGIILWEMVYRLISGRHARPYHEYPAIQHDFQIIIQAATKGLRPTIPSVCPEPMTRLIKATLSAHPDERPSCEELLGSLASIQKVYEANSAEWDSVVFKAEGSGK